MRVSVSLNHHFCRTPDGAIWTLTMFAYPFWARYLDVFDSVRVIARVRDVDSASDGWQRADGNEVRFATVPDFVGPAQYLRRSNSVRSAIRSLTQDGDTHILRVPSIISTLVWKSLRRDRRPYGVEVCGDPWDGLSPGSFTNVLLPVFRGMYTRNQRRQCAGAAAAAYVTREALQRRYPCRSPQNDRLARHCTYYSSVELRPDDLVAAARPINNTTSPVRLIFVGSIGHLKKAPDDLIRAVAAAVRQGNDLQLTVVGGGGCQSELERLAADVGIRSRVRFTGALSAGKLVRDELDRADLFVLPSRHEGLPRAMIEAMARALPCIGSTVGGFAELVPWEDLVPPNDCDALTHKICEIVADPVRLMRMSARNLEKARQYVHAELQQRRIKFYKFLHERTQAAQAERRPNNFCLNST